MRGGTSGEGLSAAWLPTFEIMPSAHSPAFVNVTGSSCKVVKGKLCCYQRHGSVILLPASGLPASRPESLISSLASALRQVLMGLQHVLELTTDWRRWGWGRVSAWTCISLLLLHNSRGSQRRGDELLVPLTPPHFPLGSNEHFRAHKGNSAWGSYGPVPF